MINFTWSPEIVDDDPVCLISAFEQHVIRIKEEILRKESNTTSKKQMEKTDRGENKQTVFA